MFTAGSEAPSALLGLHEDDFSGSQGRLPAELLAIALFLLLTRSFFFFLIENLFCFKAV